MLNKSRMVPLAEYSRDLLCELRQKLDLHYDDGAKGTLQLFRRAAQLDDIAKDVKVLEHYGVPHAVLDRAGCLAAEPGLAAVPGKVAGGLQLPDDETGDCFKFVSALRVACERLGVVFRFGTRVTGLMVDGDRISGIEIDGGRIEGNAYVAALASFLPAIMKKIGIDVPIYPVKGYSLTVPVLDPEHAPVSTVMDETHKVAITRLGSRIRVGGMAELAGYSVRRSSGRLATLRHVVSDLFPRGGDYAAPEFWCGLRPMTPDGPPIIGPTKFRNLFINSGHGTLGWTMACGSAAVLRDIIAVRPPAIDVTGLSIDRYRR
jgi:D-amino-acid dehydrogenase